MRSGDLIPTYKPATLLAAIFLVIPANDLARISKKMARMQTDSGAVTCVRELRQPASMALKPGCRQTLSQIETAIFSPP